MKKISTFILTLFLVSNILAQELPIQVEKIKTCVDRNSIHEDSVFLKSLSEIKLNINLYTIVDISEIISYRNSLLVSKTPYTTMSYDIFYKTLDELNFNSFRNKVINDSKKPSIKNNKLLMCYRTLSPDEKGKYKVHFYILE